MLNCQLCDIFVKPLYSLFHKDFSLTGFMAENSVTTHAQITGLVLEKLKETLALSNLMNVAQCSLTDAKYTPNNNGIKNGNTCRCFKWSIIAYTWLYYLYWKNYGFAQTNFIRDLKINVYFFPLLKIDIYKFCDGCILSDCSRSVNQPVEGTTPSLVTSLPSNTLCQISSSCTAIDCCVEVTPLSHSFHIYLDINPCDISIKFGIDKVQFTFNLKDFTFGKEKDFRLSNVVRMRWVLCHVLVLV